jgi:hypothetical protein
MDIYTPVLAIIMYIASLLAPEGTNEFTLSEGEKAITYTKEAKNTWKRTDAGGLGMISFEGGYFIEATEPTDMRQIKELMSDHISLPVDLDKGAIDLKRAPIKIKFEKKDELIIFTITREGQPSSDIRISWTD